MESDFNNCVTIIQVMISFFSDTLIIYLLLLPLNQGQTFYKVNNSAVCLLLLVIIIGGGIVVLLLILIIYLDF